MIYVGAFSKVMFPALRLGYLVIPEDLCKAFATMRDASDQFSSTLYQAVITDFIREGHFARHIRRMRMLYMERRKALVDAIEDQAGNKLQVIGEEAGMHLVALLPRGTSDVAVSKRAAEMGISAMPLSTCYSKRCVRPGLILAYGERTRDEPSKVFESLEWPSELLFFPAITKRKPCEFSDQVGAPRAKMGGIPSQWEQASGVRTTSISRKL